MARNRVQMQKGLSLTEFCERYGTEEQCREAVVQWRWPDGFVCPHCGSRDHSIVGIRALYLCHDCLTQTSIKAGTIFARTLLPLTKWFQGMYLLTQAKNSISTLELARQLGVRPDTASLMRHKLMSVMVEREGSRKLDGRVEMDDAVLGGERLLLHVVKVHDGEAIAAMAKAHLEPTARIVSDGLGCFRAVTKAGCAHEPVNVSKTFDGKSEKLVCFRWVNTVLGNVKTAIVGTLKSVAKRYVFRYLAEFQYRFNRRFKLPEMLDRLACVATQAKPRPYKTLKIEHEAG